MHIPSEDSLPSARGQHIAFPFSLVARWIIATLVIAYGAMRLVDLVNGWSWLADRAIINVSYNPFFRLVAESCILFTGILLLRRSRFVFIPLSGHIAIFMWLVFGFGPIQLSAGVSLMWAGQSTVLAFSMWLLMNQRLR